MKSMKAERIKVNLGASPQLECWNNGIMGSGIMG